MYFCKEFVRPVANIMIGELLINKNYYWVFFDGTFQEPQNRKSIGGLFFLSDGNYIIFKEYGVRGTNNYT